MRISPVIESPSENGEQENMSSVLGYGTAAFSEYA